MYWSSFKKDNMKKKQMIIVAAAATCVLMYLLIKRNFDNPNKSLVLKAKLDSDKILNYKFAG